MGILSTIFGSGEVITKGLELIDSFHTSETEAIEAKTKAKTDLLTAYAPFKVAQRYLALLFTFTFLGSFLGVLIASLTGYADVDIIREVLAEFYIGEIMLSIVLFYFGAVLSKVLLNQEVSNMKCRDCMYKTKKRKAPQRGERVAKNKKARKNAY